jgi:hypothetical protein
LQLYIVRQGKKYQEKKEGEKKRRATNHLLFVTVQYKEKGSRRKHNKSGCALGRKSRKKKFKKGRRI